MTDIRDGWIFRDDPERKVERISRLDEDNSAGQAAAGGDQINPNPPQWFAALLPAIRAA